jgi:hypothetical protein
VADVVNVNVQGFNFPEQFLDNPASFQGVNFPGLVDE